MRILIEDDPDRWAQAFAILQAVANGFTVVGVLVAILAGWIAYSSLMATSTAARQAHMHTLFRDYLRMRAEPNPATTLNEKVSFKLYALEEMFYWIQAERALARWRWVFKRKTLAKQRAIAGTWEATVAHHLKYDAEATAKGLQEFRPCYGPEFFAWATSILAQVRPESPAGGRDRLLARFLRKFMRRPRPAAAVQPQARSRRTRP